MKLPPVTTRLLVPLNILKVPKRENNRDVGSILTPECLCVRFDYSAVDLSHRVSNI